MKKVRLLIAMMLVIAALAVGVMAADTDYVGFELEEIETGDTITVNVVSKQGFTAEICTFGISYNAEKWTVEENSNDAGVNGNVIDYVKESCTVAEGGTIFTFTATPISGAASVVGETFVMTYCQCVGADAIYVDATNCDTLTVVAAGPVATAKTVEEAVEFDASDITIDGQVYTNVAVFDGSMSFPELADGESITDGGIKYNGEKVHTFPSISGGGSATYKALFYGITDAEAADLAAVLKSFYTGMFFPAAN